MSDEPPATDALAFALEAIGRPAFVLDEGGAVARANAAGAAFEVQSLEAGTPEDGAALEVELSERGQEQARVRGRLRIVTLSAAGSSVRLGILEEGSPSSEAPRGSEGFAADLSRQLRTPPDSRRLDAASTRTLVREEVRYLRALVDGIEHPIYLRDLEGRYLVANDATAKVVGLDRAEQLHGKSHEELLEPEVAAEVRAGEEAIVRSGEPRTYRMRFALPGLPLRTYLITKSVYRDDDGHALGVIGTSRDVTDLDQAREELTQANEELAEANYDLASFATVAGHDLRTPLRGVHNLAGFLLEDHPELPAEATDELRSIQRLAKRADRMILDLLEFSRTGRVEVRLAETDVRELLDTLLDERQVALAEAEITVAIETELPRTRLWRTGLYQVFDHLLQNALQHAASSASLELGCTSTDDAFQFYVRDHGPGVEPSLEPKIFEPFARTRRPGGSSTSGLGLAVVRRTLRRMGGTVWHEPTPGGGSTFHFELPRQAPRPSAPE